MTARFHWACTNRQQPWKFKCAYLDDLELHARSDLLQAHAGLPRCQVPTSHVLRQRHPGLCRLLALALLQQVASNSVTKTSAVQATVSRKVRCCALPVDLPLWTQQHDKSCARLYYIGEDPEARSPCAQKRQLALGEYDQAIRMVLMVTAPF